ncbi:mitochondrial ribosomal small subunit component [Sticta canariensis]|nr:mitochondrial ribosomal small subunit component [Sticta canariensis]
MGRYDFRPLRVHQTATHLLALQKTRPSPPWLDVIGMIPPAQALVRTQPLQRPRRSKTKKPSKMFQPTRLVYEEDALRKTFFTDHPWELARPRMVLEEDGKDAEKDDWSRISQPHRKLSGESVVQRQLWLIENQNISRGKAYEQARKEFYALRLQEDVERRVAKEEALATGAYFGKSAVEIGMELEDKEYERWRDWANKQFVEETQRRLAAYSGGDGAGSADGRIDDFDSISDVDSTIQDDEG